MAAWFESGDFVTLVLAVIVAEGAALVWLHKRRGVGPRPLAVVANLAAGGLVFVALERALSGASWVWIAAFAGASLPAHLLDLRLRWPTAGARRKP